MSFDPDAYLATPQKSAAATAFDPDAYLATPPQDAGGGFDPDTYLATPVPTMLRPAPDPSIGTRVREALSPLIGETPRQTAEREAQLAGFAKQLPGVAAAAAAQPGFEKYQERAQGGAITAIEQAAFTPAPGTPQIPMIPPQEGAAAQVGAGVVNALSGVANMLPSPGGMIGMMGGGPGLAVLAGGAPSMVRAGSQGVATLSDTSSTVQDKASAATGLALVAGGAALGARQLLKPRAPLPDAGPKAPLIDVEVLFDAPDVPPGTALPSTARPALAIEAPRMAADLARITGGRLELPDSSAPIPSPVQPLPTLLALPDSAPLSTAKPPLFASLRPAPDAARAPAAPLEAAAKEVGAIAAPEFSGAADSSVLSPEGKPTGRRFRLSPLADGTPDLLNAIEDAGGIRGPRPGEKFGEYDGFAQTFNSGLPRLLRNRSGQAVDQLMGELAEQGYRFETPDDFYRAVNQAVQTRTKLRAQFEAQLQNDTFTQAALENRGRATGESAGRPVPVDGLQIGDKFKIKREPFEVVDIDPQTFDVIVRDGPRFGQQTLPAGTKLFADKRTLRRVPKAEADQWPDMTPDPVPVESAAAPAANEWGDMPAPSSLSQESTSGTGAAPAQPLALKPTDGGSTPPPATNPPAPLAVRRGAQTVDMFDSGLGDAPFTMTGETAQDFTGIMDQKAAAAARAAEADAAQGRLFDASGYKRDPGSLGAAAGMDSWRQVQKILAPESLLPAEFRTATRFSEQAQRSIIQQGISIQGDLRKALAQSRKAAPGVDRLTYDYLTGQQPLTALPPAVRGPAFAARGLVDTLSQRAIREGVVSGQLATTFGSNLGSYLRRSYQLFANPDYVPAHSTKRAAVAYVQANWDPRRILSLSEAETIVNQLIERPAAAQFIIGGKIAGRDVSSLVQRQNLAPEIRALYGEITDPLEAFGQTVPRLARMIENHAAQQWIRLVGLRNGLFSTTADPLRHRQLVADSSKPHEVWRGLYTTPELAEAMQREVRSGRADGIGEGLLRMVRTATGLSKMTKTVLNPDSYAPNFVGGLVTMAANGNFNVLPMGRGLLLAGEELGALRAAGLLPASRAGLQADLVKLTKLGLRGESVSGADLVQTWERSLLPQFTAKTGRVLLPWLKTYGAIDDTTKYIAWKSELARIQRWAPQMPLEAAERMAAERVRATMPTYSNIPRFVRELSQLGIAPSFVNFTWEVFRNTMNTARLAARDMADGAKANNPAQVADGARRAAALLAVAGASTGAGIALLSRREAGITDEQDEAVRFFGAPYNREAQLVYSGSLKDGKLQFANSSYLLPHALLTQALEAGLRAKTDEEAAKAFLNSFKEQFLSADGGVLLGPAMEAFIGYDRATGRPILNRESMTPTADALQFLYDRSFDPLVRKKLERAIMAARGEAGPFGRTYSLKEELVRLAGVRAQTIDFNLAVDFKARELARRFGDASNIYTAMRNRNIKPEPLEAAYQAAEKSRQRVFGEIQDYLRLAAAVGVKEDKTIKALREARGLGAEVILGALEGRYVPQAREKAESMAAAVERVGGLPAAEAQRETIRLATENPAFLRALVEAKRKQALGVTQRDELVLGLSASDGSRAAYIREQMLAKPDAAARNAYLVELARKRVLTEQVAAQMLRE